MTTPTTPRELADAIARVYLRIDLGGKVEIIKRDIDLALDVIDAWALKLDRHGIGPVMLTKAIRDERARLQAEQEAANTAALASGLPLNAPIN